jgi:hypothetical protein
VNDISIFYFIMLVAESSRREVISVPHLGPAWFDRYELTNSTDTSLNIFGPLRNQHEP